MGEMADDIIDAMFDRMLDDDDDMLDCDLDTPGGTRRAIRAKTCRACGEEGLVWMQIESRWLLGDGKAIHQCPVNPYRAQS